MKKSVIALLLSVICLFGGCDISGMTGGDSTGSSASSSLGSSEHSTGGSSDIGNNSTDDNDDNDDNNGDNGNTDDEEHTDADKDDKCDDCGETVAVTFDFFAINDLHGKFEDTDTQPGVDELSTYLKNARAENENTIFLSSGDMWQGSSESNFTKGLIITDWMNEMGFAAMTLGNHEYDWGVEYIEANAELAEFPFLALNIYDNETNKRVDYCQPSVMVEKNGVKIGIIGAMGDCYSSISGDKVQDVYFKTGSALTALVKTEARNLRSKGADCIVYSIHDGYASDNPISSYYDIELSDYVDVVFEGHTHQQYVMQDTKGVYHLQDGGDNDGISHVEMKINFANDEASVQDAKFLSTSVYSKLEDDPIVDTLMEKYADQIAKASKVLGTNDRVRGGDEILQKAADLYYEAGVERWGDEYDIALGGGFMSVRSPYNIYAGEVLYGDLMSVLPFDNQLVLCSISGYYLRKRFFENTDSRYYIGYGAYGESIKNNISSGATYYVVTDTYSSLYAANHLTEIERYDETTFARDLLADFIEKGGWGLPSAGGITLTSILDIEAIGERLKVNEETSEQYYVKGMIVEITHPDLYGNMTIQDEEGNQLYVFGTWDKTGSNRYGNMTEKPQVGDTITLVGTIKRYVNGSTDMVELMNGRIYFVE